MPHITINEATEAEIDKMFELYHQAFEPLRTLTATKQTLSDGELRALLDFDATSIFIAYARNAEPAAFAVAVGDLKLIPWINPEFYARLYPEHYATGRIFYFPAMLVDPKHQKGTGFMRVIREIAHWVAEMDAILVMDCCAHNVEIERLPEIVAAVGRKHAHVAAFDEIDRQAFFAYHMKPLDSVA